MKDLAIYLLSFLVDKPDEVEVSESESSNGNILINIKVAKEDMGRVIGKEGRIINSIRDMLKILAVKQNKYVDITLAE